MAFSFLEKNSLKELAEAAKTSLQPVFDDLKEYERVANNKPKSNIPKGLPQVTDGTVAAYISSTPRTIIQQIPTGKVKSLDDDKDLAGIADLVLTEKILPNANSTGGVIQKSWAALSNALTYGSQPAYVFYKRDGNYMGADFKLVSIRDVWYEPGKSYAGDCNYIFMRAWYQKKDIEAIINNGKRAKQEGLDYPWDLEALADIEEKNREEEQEDSNKQRKAIEIVFAFQKGIGATFYGFNMDTGDVLYETKNPDPTGKMPIVTLYADIDDKTPIGKSAIRFVVGLQNMLDTEMQMYQYSQALGLAPPIIKRGVYSSETLRMKPNAIWDLGANDNNSAQIVNLSTPAQTNFSNNYSLIKSQIMNHNNISDSSISSTAGNVSFSKTSAGVQQQENRISISNNQLMKNFEDWFGNLCERMLNVHFALSYGEEEIELTEQYIKREKVHNPDFDATSATILYDAVKNGFNYRVDASTSKTKDDQASVESLEKILELSQKYPNLQQVFDTTKIGERIIAKLGVEDPEELVINTDKNSNGVPDTQEMTGDENGLVAEQ